MAEASMNIDFRKGDIVTHKSLTVYGYDTGVVNTVRERADNNPHPVCVSWRSGNCGVTAWHSPHELDLKRRDDNAVIPGNASELWISGEIRGEHRGVLIYGVFGSMADAMRPGGSNPVCSGINTQFVGRMTVGVPAVYKGDGEFEGVEDVLWYVSYGVWKQWFRIGPKPEPEDDDD